VAGGARTGHILSTADLEVEGDRRPLGRAAKWPSMVLSDPATLRRTSASRMWASGRESLRWRGAAAHGSI